MRTGQLRSPMSNRNDQDTFTLLPRYFACYGILTVIVAIMTWLMLQLRTVIVQIALALGLSSWTMTVVDQFGVILLGILWLIAFLVIEAYLRQGVPINKLRSRAIKIIIWEFILIILVFVALQILA
jgi:hypothetical protein